MSARVVKLSVHRNTSEHRESKRMVGEIRRKANVAQRGLNGKMAGYCLVGWDKDGTTFVGWEGVKHLHQCPLAEFVHQEITRQVCVRDVADTLFPPPPDKGA